MTLVVGLGNPTPAYKNNRHNIGFMAINYLLDGLNPTKINKSIFKGELFKISKILFLKPMTYMNNSGESVLKVVNYYDVEDVIVIHDDMEIPFGSIRLKRGGGNGGHNGLKSIDSHIGNDYGRVRIGISKPPCKNDISNYVLSDFTEIEQMCLPKILEHSKKAIECLLENDVTSCQSKYNIKKSICID